MEISPENPERLKEQLKAREYGMMIEFARLIKDNCEKQGFPRDKIVAKYCITATEHTLFASSSPGKVFYPNVPLASLMDFSLEEINTHRAQMNLAPRRYPMIDPSSQTGPINLLIEFLPLEQNDLELEDVAPTFRIIGADAATAASLTDSRKKNERVKISIPDFTENEIASHIEEERRKGLEWIKYRSDSLR